MIDFFFRSFNLLLRDSAEGSKLIDESEAGKKGATAPLKMEQQDWGVISVEPRPESPVRVGVHGQAGAPPRIPQ